MRRLNSLFQFSGFMIILLTLGSLSSRPYSAQQSDSWFPGESQQRIPDYGPTTWTPYLVADQNGTVHAFASDWVGPSEAQQRAIVYRRWSLVEGWTDPLDVLLAPEKQAVIQDAVLDQEGTLHVIFVGGIAPIGELFYAKAPAIIADRASAWTVPEAVGPVAIAPFDASLVVNSKGHLYIMYSSGVFGNGLYAMHSFDSGQTWSSPLLVFLTYDQYQWPWESQAYVDEHDGLHVVWAINDITGNAVSVNYVSLEAGSEEWGKPIELASIKGLPSGSPSIIEHEKELFVIYFGPSPDSSMTRTMRKSSDGGQNWTEPLILFPHIGNQGAASLVIDSDNIMHMLFGNRVTLDNFDQPHGMWHSIWQGVQWSTPKAIVSGPVTPYFDPNFAHAVVSRGNVILVTWMGDWGAMKPPTGGTWYAYTVLDTPELTVVPLPTLTPTPSNTPSPTTPPPISTAILPESDLTNQGDVPPRRSENPSMFVIASIVPVALFLLIFIGVSQLSHHR